MDRPEQAQVDGVVDALRDILGGAVRGVYLHGSAVLDRLRPRSDLDLLVVTDRPTTHAEKRRLTDRLLAISDRDDDPRFRRCLELTIVVGPEIRPWRYPPPIDYLYGEWLRGALAAGHVEPAAPTSPDLATVISIVRLGDHPIVGPPPAELLDPVPPADLRRAMTDELRPLLDDLETDTRNVVLTLARIWTTLATGEIRSKDGAARWALDRLPAEHRPVLARARAVYLGEEAETWDDLRPQIHAHVDFVLGRIRQA